MELHPVNSGGTGENFIRACEIKNFYIIKNINPNLYSHALIPLSASI
jgi:hypothetical protein